MRLQAAIELLETTDVDVSLFYQDEYYDVPKHILQHFVCDYAERTVLEVLSPGEIQEYFWRLYDVKLPITDEKTVYFDLASEDVKRWQKKIDDTLQIKNQFLQSIDKKRAFIEGNLSAPELQFERINIWEKAGKYYSSDDVPYPTFCDINLCLYAILDPTNKAIVWGVNSCSYALSHYQEVGYNSYGTWKRREKELQWQRKHLAKLLKEYQFQQEQFIRILQNYLPYKATGEHLGLQTWQAELEQILF